MLTIQAIILPAILRLHADRDVALLDDRMLADIGIDRRGRRLVSDLPAPAPRRPASILDERYAVAGIGSFMMVHV
jgi:hypothetical protein